MEGSLIGDYRLLSQLGEGAAGRVFLATPTRPKDFAKPGEPLAIKIYKEEILKQPKQIERIKQEFKIGSQIAHPNVVRIYDYNIDSKPPYLVMEYVDGITLEGLGGMFYPIPERLLVHLLRQLAKGIHQLHSDGIIHRDLKPENIMVSSSFKVKVMDLGVVQNPREYQKLTPSDKFLGTIRNAAPEYLFGESCSESSDLYSFGTILYFLLHGEQVFSEEKQFAKLVTLVKEVDPEFDASLERQSAALGELAVLCKRLLGKNPNDRVADSAAIISKLEELSKSIGGSVEEPVHAYMATALTGLGSDAREAIMFVSARVAEVCKKFDIFVYQPRKATDPVRHADISAGAVYLLDRRRVTSAGFLIVLANHPSFGVGQEIEIAASYGKPTLLIRNENVKVSRMVTGSHTNFLGEDITYSTPEDLEKKLKTWLGRHGDKIKAWVESSRRSIPQELTLRLGDLREGAEYGIAEAAERIGISPLMLEALEHQPLSFHNVGLQTLYRICYLYGADIREMLSPGPVRLGVAPDDPNLRRLEEMAVKADWHIADYLELKREYEKEIAGRGAPIILSDDDWMKRHAALERRKLQ